MSINRTRPLLAALGCLVMAAAVGLAVGQWYGRVLIKDARSTTATRMTITRDALHSALERRLALLHGLKAFVIQELQSPAPDLSRSFAPFAAALLTTAPGIRNFAVSPGGINRHVYPVKGNEKAIGHNLFSDPRPRVKAAMARMLRTGKMTLNGPYQLRQGGLGLVARIPVFGKGEFWGLVAMVVDIPPILAEAGLGEREPGLELKQALRLPGRRAFSGPDRLFTGDAVIRTIHLPEGRWEMAGLPRGGWWAMAHRSMWLFGLVWALFSITAAGLTWLLISRHGHLARAVTQRTSDLEAVNSELSVKIRDTRRARLDLARSVSRWRSVVDNASNFITLVNRQYQVTFINNTVEGLSTEDVIGQSVFDFINPEYHDLARRRLNQVFNEGKSVHYISKAAGPGGEPAWYDNRLGPVIADSQIEEAAIIAADITRRLTVESSLKLRDEQFRQVVENAAEGIFIIQDGIFGFVNPKGAELMGVTAESLIGQDFQTFNHPDDRALLHKRVERRLSGEKVSEKVEHRIVDINGRVKWVAVHSTVVDWQGEPANMAFVRDITDRKQAERALRDTEAQVRLLLNSTAEAIYGVDRQGLCTFCNPACLRMLGYDHERQLLGRNMHRLIMEPPLEAIPRSGVYTVEDAMANGERIHRDNRTFWRKDGSTLPVEFWSHPLEKDNEVVGAVVTFMDISRRLETEAGRAELENQLRQSQKMEAIGTLAGGIAHDFNNILAAISGYAELAREDIEAGKPDPGLLDSILASTERARELVARILTFSRKPHTRLEPLDLGEQIRAAAGLLENTIPKMIDIRLDLAGNLPPVSGNPNQIEQVVMNLGANAADAMPDGGRLTLSTRLMTIGPEDDSRYPGLEPGGYVRLRVIDTGQGMNDEVLEKIFDPFFTTKEVGKGTGLGLSIVFSIVSAHQGHVSAASSPDAGTVITVLLPVAGDDQTLITTAMQAPVDGLPVNGTGAPALVLLVDDEQALLDVAGQMLHRGGYRVMTANTGEEALEIYLSRGEEIDLVILDLSMPGMGGHRCLEELVRLDPGIRVIIASGYDRLGQADDLTEMGASSFVAKPFSRRELLTAVAKALAPKTET